MNGKEVLEVVEIVQNEKDVATEDVFQALEVALSVAARKNFNDTLDIRVQIDRNTGDYETYRRWEVIDDEDKNFNSPDYQILLSAAQNYDTSLNPGDYVEEQIENVPLGRISAHTAKQVIVQKLREAERMHVASQYRDKIGTLVMGIAKREDYSGLYVDLGNNTEGFIPHDALIPRDNIRTGLRVRAYLREVREDMRGPQLIMSRTAPEFLIELFHLEVPEVGEGLIEIKGAARDPGMRAKIAVYSKDPRLDPIGACVGMRGARVQAISNELAGERIDIVPWDDNFAKFVVNAMAPATIISIVMDEEQRSVDIAVEEEKLSQAIGRGGQNVRLASQLLGWKLNVITTQEAEDKSEHEAQDMAKLLCEKLDVDEEIASILLQEGYTNIEEIAYAPAEDLAKIEEFDEQIVSTLQSRASDALLSIALSEQGDPSPMNNNELTDVSGVDQALAIKLIEHGIRTREELAEQAVDDLLDIRGMNREVAAQLIMEARIPWFQSSEGN